MLRLNSSASLAESAPWAPLGDFLLQVDQPDRTTVEIHARLATDAPWVIMGAIREGGARILRIDAVTEVKILSRNPTGLPVRVWSD